MGIKTIKTFLAKVQQSFNPQTDDATDTEPGLRKPSELEKKLTSLCNKLLHGMKSPREDIYSLPIIF